MEILTWGMFSRTVRHRPDYGTVSILPRFYSFPKKTLPAKAMVITQIFLQKIQSSDFVEKKDFSLITGCECADIRKIRKFQIRPEQFLLP